MGGDFEFVVEQVSGRGEPGAETLVPRPVRRSSESVLDKQLQMRRVVVGGAGESVVVEGLSVVGVSARVEQESCKFEGVAVRWLVGFAATECSGERRERWYEAVPQEPGVRIRTAVEQDACRGEGRPACVRRVESGVAAVEQWRPVVWAARRVDDVRVLFGEFGHGLVVSAHCDRSGGRRCEIRVGVDHFVRHGGSGVWVVIAVVGDARQRRESVSVLVRVDVSGVRAR